MYPRTKLRTKMVLALAAIAVFAIPAVTAASASAATWVGGNNTMKWTPTTSITLKKNGGSATTCTWPGGKWWGNPPESGAFNAPIANGVVSNYIPIAYITTLECAGGKKFEFSASFTAPVNGTSGVFPITLVNRYWAYGQYASPFEKYTQMETNKNIKFVNGTALKPSTLTFTDTPLGTNGLGETISLTATFQVATQAGGLLTLTN